MDKHNPRPSVREAAICGWNACLSLFDRRPAAIRKIYMVKEKTKVLGHVLKWAASQHIAYKVVGWDDMAKVAGTSHTEGVVFIAEEKPLLSGAALLDAVDPEDRCVLVLDSISNPHNLGAIFRTSAFFSIRSVLLAGATSPHRISPAVMRVSQGGAEHLQIGREENPLPVLKRLKEKGFSLAGTDVFGKSPIEALRSQEHCALVMGSEGTGMQPGVRDMCDLLVKIPGSGRVESLNVSVACGVVLSLFSEL